MVAYRFLGYVLVLLRRCTRIYFPTKTYISRTHKLFFWDAAIRNSLPSNKEQNILLYVCVIQHRNWPLRSTILNAHGTNASLDGLCTRTHINEAFSCWFCCKSFRVDRARRGNVCLEAWLGLGTYVPGTRTSYVFVLYPWYT